MDDLFVFMKNFNSKIFVFIIAVTSYNFFTRN